MNIIFLCVDVYHIDLLIIIGEEYRRAQLHVLPPPHPPHTTKAAAWTSGQRVVPTIWNTMAF